MPGIRFLKLPEAIAVCFVSLAGSILAQDPLPEANPPFFRIQYAPSTVSNTPPTVPTELVFGVSYSIWIPPNTDVLSGVIVHQHGCGDGACKGGRTAAFDLHWQALAAKHGCALMGPSYEQPEGANCSLWCDPRHGSESKFLKALDELAAKTGHPELATVPWALWGHSGGAAWVGNMLMLHPSRTIAVWLRSGSPRVLASEEHRLPPLEIPDAALSVPVMSNLGTQEGVTVTDGRFSKVWKTTEQFFQLFRQKGGLIGVAIDPKSSHDCGDSRYLAIPWFDACLTERLPSKAGEAIKPIPIEGAWLSPLLSKTATAAARFNGDKQSAIWLPNKDLAHRWEEYVTSGNVTDTTSPPAPTNVRLHGQALSWQSTADLESGVASFIVARDGVDVARLPEKPKQPNLRPNFQGNSFHDTPTLPLAEMNYVDTTAKPGERHRYSVRAVNGVLLESAATEVAPVQPKLGMQKRFGDEIMVCGQLYRIGAPVKLWLDVGGFDAYRTERRFSPFELRKWKSTIEEMKAGKIDFVTKPQESNPDRYGMRFESSLEQHFTPQQLEQVRGGGWNLELLRDKVDQFVLHFDVCGTSAQCFHVLHDRRGLSVHFMLDVDGTIYQTLDVKERAWQATKSNDRSVGIEIANIGAYSVGSRNKTLEQWYKKDSDGQTYLVFPDSVRGKDAFKDVMLRPRRNEPVIGSIRGTQYEQYDFTTQQYDSLIKLSAALCDVFPNMKPDAPRTPEGTVIDRTLTNEQWASFSGILGHYHVQENKTDPGPAMDWEYLLAGVRKQLKLISESRKD